jgi:hypothetical protein
VSVLLPPGYIISPAPFLAGINIIDKVWKYFRKPLAKQPVIKLAFKHSKSNYFKTLNQQDNLPGQEIQYDILGGKVNDLVF